MHGGEVGQHGNVTKAHLLWRCRYSLQSHVLEENAMLETAKLGPARRPWIFWIERQF